MLSFVTTKYDDEDCVEYHPSMSMKGIPLFSVVRSLVTQMCISVNALGRKPFRRAQWVQGSFHPSRKKCVRLIGWHSTLFPSTLFFPPLSGHYGGHSHICGSRLDRNHQCGML